MYLLRRLLRLTYALLGDIIIANIFFGGAFMLEKINYSHNKSIDIKEGFVNGQGKGPAAALRYGFFPMSYNGCEIIAAYNFLKLENRNSFSLAELARDMYKDVWAFCGLLGSNVYRAARFFKKHGIPIERTLSYDAFFNALDSSKHGILSFWNACTPFKGVHTVCIERIDGGYRIYNRANSKTEPCDYKTREEVVEKCRFMCGYFIPRD